MGLVLLAAVLVAGAALAVIGNSDSDGSGKAPGRVRIISGATVLLDRPAKQLRALPRPRLRHTLGRLPRGRRERRGRAVIAWDTDEPALQRAVGRALRADGGVVRLPERRVAANTRLPIVKQALRNICESAALSMLLASRGIKADQLSLQRQLPRNGPLDPQQSGGATLWGDPDHGFVGRPNGGGTSGGYGVYEGPIRDLARHHGAKLRKLRGSSPAAIYRQLLAGHPVMVWVGLTDGPFQTWQTPSGRAVTGNFGEHTVVLTGIDGQTVAVNDPLTGSRVQWSRDEFEQLWERLGRRALV